MLSIFTMIALISALIIAHEWGHYSVARWCGVRVERFGFGLPFGPTLWKKKIGQTEFCLHPILFGGYVSFPDDTPESSVPKQSPERFENRPHWQQLAIALAGIAVNAVLAFGLMLAVISVWGFPSANVGIEQILGKDSPAAHAGLMAGDTIVAVNHKPVAGVHPQDRIGGVIATIGKFAGKPLTLTVTRKNTTKTLTVVPNASGKIGIGLGAKPVYIRTHSLWQSAELSAQFLSRFVVMNFQSLGQLITGKADPSQLSGPIRIVQVGAQLIDHHGIQEGLILTAVISMILAVMNLLPIPALDGGHVLFILLDACKIAPNALWKERFVQAGFYSLLAVMGYVLWHDIWQGFIHKGP